MQKIYHFPCIPFERSTTKKLLHSNFSFGSSSHYVHKSLHQTRQIMMKMRECAMELVVIASLAASHISPNRTIGACRRALGLKVTPVFVTQHISTLTDNYKQKPFLHVETGPPNLLLINCRF